MPKLSQSYRDKCTHFNGLINDTCSAGVVYLSVDPDPQPNNFAIFQRLPCFRSNNAPATCAQCHYPTPEEVEEHERAMQQHMARFRERAALVGAAHTDAPVSNVWICQVCAVGARFVTTHQDDILAHMEGEHAINLDALRACTGHMLAHMDATEWFQNDTEFRDGDRSILIRSVRHQRRGSDRAIRQDISGKRKRR